MQILLNSYLCSHVPCLKSHTCSPSTLLYNWDGGGASNGPYILMQSPTRLLSLFSYNSGWRHMGVKWAIHIYLQFSLISYVSHILIFPFCSIYSTMTDQPCTYIFTVSVSITHMVPGFSWHHSPTLCARGVHAWFGGALRLPRPAFAVPSRSCDAYCGFPLPPWEELGGVSPTTRRRHASRTSCSASSVTPYQLMPGIPLSSAR